MFYLFVIMLADALIVFFFFESGYEFITVLLI